eukprot:scaffold86514_cov28-Attheya_sp.AAC.1
MYSKLQFYYYHLSLRCCCSRHKISRSCGACSVWTGTLGGWTGGVGTDCAIFGRILRGRCLGVTWRKIAASCWIASAWGRLSFAYGAAGAGLRRAW